MNKISHPMKTARIKKVVEENYRIKTFVLSCSLEDAEPGQFIMLWLPGIGERPMGIADNSPLTISVAKVGPFSSELHKLKEGDRLSFRGPLGKGFSFPEKKGKLVLVCGGYGVSPLHFLAKKASEEGFEADAIIGGRSKKDIIFMKRLSAVCSSVLITTDDGSEGEKGTVMVSLGPILKRGVACVYACGPERMMRAVAEECKKAGVPSQLLLERHMKCGVGVCGSCDIDGLCVCKDGPVFEGEKVLSLADFGKTKRDKSGRKIPL